MCGIFGYIGKEKACKFILNGLKKLDYRGYDSSGIATLDDSFHVAKQVGCIDNLCNVVKQGKVMDKLLGNLGIGHVRWATHGIISERNAHPHLSCDKRIAVVHNGVVYNDLSLRRDLLERGHVLISDTDSELIAHLIEQEYNEHVGIFDSTRNALKQIEAQYALLILCKDEPDKIIAAKNKAPLWIGRGSSGYFGSSDVLSLIGNADEYLDLKDGDTAILSDDTVKIFDTEGKQIHREFIEVPFTEEEISKGNFDYFILKEILEQPDIVRKLVDEYIKNTKIDIFTDTDLVDIIKKLDRVILFGSGSSYFASRIGELYLKKIAKIVDVHSIVASELKYSLEDAFFSNEKLQETFVLAITQSGATRDTIAALEFLKNKFKVLSITNMQLSEAERKSDYNLNMLAGFEISVAATKSFLAEIIMLLLISLRFGEIKNTIDRDFITEIIEQMKNIPYQIEYILSQKTNIKNTAKKYYDRETIFFVSRGINVPTALEAGRKAEELLYISTLGTSLGSAGEFKHGPLALIRQNFPVVIISPYSSELEKIIINAREAKSHGAKIIAIATEGNNTIKEIADDIIWIPKVNELLSPILAIVALQLLIRDMAQLKGTLTDRPLNLAKVATVE